MSVNFPQQAAIDALKTFIEERFAARAAHTQEVLSDTGLDVGLNWWDFWDGTRVDPENMTPDAKTNELLCKCLSLTMSGSRARTPYEYMMFFLSWYHRAEFIS